MKNTKFSFVCAECKTKFINVCGTPCPKCKSLNVIIENGITTIDNINNKVSNIKE